MSGFDVAPNELHGASAHLGEVGEELGAGLVALDSLVDGVLGSWRGDAATAFLRGWDEWRHGAREGLAALEAMSELLRSTLNEYTYAETASTVSA